MLTKCLGIYWWVLRVLVEPLLCCRCCPGCTRYSDGWGRCCPWFLPLGSLILIHWVNWSSWRLQWVSCLDIRPGNPFPRNLNLKLSGPSVLGRKALFFLALPLLMTPGRQPREVVPIFRVECILYLLYQRLLWMWVTKTDQFKPKSGIKE